MLDTERLVLFCDQSSLHPMNLKGADHQTSMTRAFRDIREYGTISDVIML